MKLSSTYRQWLILNMMPRRRRISTKEIVSRLETEHGLVEKLRTIQRDLVELERNEFPLECDTNRPAGWRWREDAAALDIPNMDPSTALTFRLVNKHLSKMFPKGALQALQPYFKTADRVAGTFDSKFGSWPDKIRVVSQSIPQFAPEVCQDVADNIYTALLDNRQFNAVYRTSWGAVKEYRDVSPLGIVFKEGQIYVVAYHKKTRKMMMLHRFQEVELIDSEAVIPEGFDLDEYIAKEFKYPLGEDIRIKVVFDYIEDINSLKERPIALDQHIVEKEETWILDGTVSDSHQLRWWLRSYGDRIEVKSPPSLRNEFAEIAMEMASRYRTYRKPRQIKRG